MDIGIEKKERTIQCQDDRDKSRTKTFTLLFAKMINEAEKNSYNRRYEKNSC